MPLIYMHKGVLGRVADRKLLGACGTVKEAKGKVSRILHGDQTFTHEVIEAQKQILVPFMPDYCEQVWRRALSTVPSLQEHCFTT
jgi:leucyl-tRNA synthetase